MTQNNAKEKLDEPSGSESLQRVIQVGQAASELLGAPVFNLMYVMMMNRLTAESDATEPKEERKRESIHFQKRALEQMTQNMGDAVAEAQRVLQEQQNSKNPEDVKKEYLDGQGFNLNY